MQDAALYGVLSHIIALGRSARCPPACVVLSCELAVRSMTGVCDGIIHAVLCHDIACKFYAVPFSISSWVESSGRENIPNVLQMQIAILGERVLPWRNYGALMEICVIRHVTQMEDGVGRRSIGDRKFHLCAGWERIIFSVALCRLHERASPRAIVYGILLLHKKGRLHDARALTCTRTLINTISRKYGLAMKYVASCRPGRDMPPSPLRLTPLLEEMGRMSCDPSLTSGPTMPEGPEVRSCADEMRDIMLGKFLRISRIPHGGMTASDGQHLLESGAVVMNVICKGKKIFIETSATVGDERREHLWILIALGMYGRVYREDVTIALAERRRSIVLDLRNLLYYRCDPLGVRSLALVDMASAGTLLYYCGYGAAREFSILPRTLALARMDNLGPDILEHAMAGDYVSREHWLSHMNRRRRSSICRVLMEQSFISGIGNYLKSEILYMCGIHPETKVGSLLAREMENIRVVSHELVLESYRLGGLTIESPISPSGVRGRYLQRVYGRSSDDRGHPVVRSMTSDGRCSYYVPSLQLLPVTAPW